MITKFSATEKVIFGILFVVLTITAASLALRVNRLFMIPIPAHGGSITEGVVGLPRLINPVIAVSDVDRDISSLIYSGLLKNKNGSLTPDLAASYTVSDDGLIYTFSMKANARFHDGEQVTASDVAFTIEKIQDPAIQSPHRVDWKDTEVKVLNPNQIQFTLKQAYAPFINNFTIGIIPKHIWKNVDANAFILSKYNIEPIGSGPYQLDHITQNSGGIPTMYSLTPFSGYVDGEAYISSLTIEFFANETAAVEAVKSGAIDSLAAVSPGEAMSIASNTPSARIVSTPLPRIFGIFLNQNSTLFTNKEVRQALSKGIDKDLLVHDILNGYGVAIDSPIPFGVLNGLDTKTKSENATSSKESARTLLEKAGWTLNADGIYEKVARAATAAKAATKGSPATPARPAVVGQTLAFSIATADSPDLKQTAEFVKHEWEKIGAHVTIQVFEPGDLTQDVIRNRKYDAVLFGEVIGKDIDLYAFWHSSQRNAPGLNLSMYVNSKADKLLEDARKSSDESVRLQKYAAFESIIQDDAPAVFLYSPNFIYIVPDKIKGLNLSEINTAWDRWGGIEKWYVNTDSVWKFFAKNQ